MKQEVAYLQKLIEKVAEKGLERARGMAEVMGVVGEEVSMKEQMEAYDALTPLARTVLAQEKGDVEMNKYVAVMEKRKRQSERMKEV